MFFKNWKNVFLFTLWILLVGLGLSLLISFSNSSGPVGPAKLIWPEKSKIGRDSSRPNLIIFLHPKCSCSRATVGELERLMVFIREKISISVVFSIAGGDTGEVLGSDLATSVKRIIGVDSVFIDEDDVESTLFGAKTSGQSYLYDKNGALVFSGGLTSARGHMGDSAGRDAILSWLRNKDQTSVFTAVFGCLIKKPNTQFNSGEM